MLRLLNNIGELPIIIRVPVYIAIVPFVVLYAIFIKNSRHDWIKAAPWFAITIILFIFALLSLSEAHHGWMSALVNFVGLWPYMELLALIVIPIFMWWLDPEDIVHPHFRIGITVFLTVLIIGGTPAYFHFVLQNWLFVIVFLLGRFLPLYFKEQRPNAKDREAETLRLGFVVLYIFFLLLPGTAVVASIWNSYGLDFHFYRYFHYFLASASYFFVMGCIELNLRDMVSSDIYAKRL